MTAGMLPVCTYDNYFVFPSQLVLIKLISRTALSTARAALLKDTKASWVLNHEYMPRNQQQLTQNSASPQNFCDASHSDEVADQGSPYCKPRRVISPCIASRVILTEN